MPIFGILLLHRFHAAVALTSWVRPVIIVKAFLLEEGGVVLVGKLLR
jgi:hypothetical protein